MRDAPLYVGHLKQGFAVPPMCFTQTSRTHICVKRPGQIFTKKMRPPLAMGK